MSDGGMVSEQASVSALGRLFSRFSQGAFASACALGRLFSRISQDEYAPVLLIRHLFSRTSRREGESGRMRGNQTAILPLVTPSMTTAYSPTGRIGRIIVGLYARTAVCARRYTRLEGRGR